MPKYRSIDWSTEVSADQAGSTQQRNSPRRWRECASDKSDDDEARRSTSAKHAVELAPRPASYVAFNPAIIAASMPRMSAPSLTIDELLPAFRLRLHSILSLYFQFSNPLSGG